MLNLFCFIMDIAVVWHFYSPLFSDSNKRVGLISVIFDIVSHLFYQLIYTMGLMSADSEIRNFFTEEADREKRKYRKRKKENREKKEVTYCNWNFGWRYLGEVAVFCICVALFSFFIAMPVQILPEGNTRIGSIVITITLNFTVMMFVMILDGKRDKFILEMKSYRQFLEEFRAAINRERRKSLRSRSPVSSEGEKRSFTEIIKALMKHAGERMSSFFDTVKKRLIEETHGAQQTREEIQKQKEERRRWLKSNEICIDDGLKEWNDEIVRMAKSYGFQRLFVCVDETLDKPADVKEHSVYGLSVFIQAGYLECIRGWFLKDDLECRDAVCFVLGHEMAHICYRDCRVGFDKIRWNFVSAGLLVLCCIMALLAGRFWFISVGLWLGGAFFLIIYLWIKYNYRFQKQFSEFRADRAAMKLSKASIKVIGTLLRKTEAEYRAPKKGQSRQRWYFDLQTHPSARFRVQELERKKSWGWKEALRYLFVLHALRKKYVI